MFRSAKAKMDEPGHKTSPKDTNNFRTSANYFCLSGILIHQAVPVQFKAPCSYKALKNNVRDHIPPPGLQDLLVVTQQQPEVAE